MDSEDFLCIHVYYVYIYFDMYISKIEKKEANNL